MRVLFVNDVSPFWSLSIYSRLQSFKIRISRRCHRRPNSVSMNWAQVLDSRQLVDRVRFLLGDIHLNRAYYQLIIENMMMNTATVDAEERESAHTLKYHEESHQVDLIVGFKRDRKGHSTFQVQMSCPCCVGRLFWFSKE